MTSPIETNNVVERLRNASQLAQKKYVTNSSELFNLAANEIERLLTERQSLSDRIDVHRRLLATARALIRVKYGNLDTDVNEFVERISASLAQGGKNV